ncbi:hypothetical protein AK812_SmicGene12771 [Symbiodinium microadriaticum]|uniref:Uncharacterized protein n=1 Tax=Symbiodinium microadriaticum TaxID=2951 RepID=A0A1Q9E9S2_SYMMI|nr:hypothetical protein AK812_SmicGene12771 [Symbiodinium microadriaticum]
MPQLPQLVGSKASTSMGTDGGGPGSSASPLLPSVSSVQPLRRRSSLSSRQRASAAELWEATLRQKLGTPGPAPPREALPSLYEHRPVASKVAQSAVPSTVGPSASVVAWFAQYQCTKCGQVPTSLDARFCHNCGAPLPLPRVPAVVTGEGSRVAINLGEVAAAAALEAIHQEGAMRGAGGGGGSLGSGGGSRLAARSEPNLHAPQRPVAEDRPKDTPPRSAAGKYDCPPKCRKRDGGKRLLQAPGRPQPGRPKELPWGTRESQVAHWLDNIRPRLEMLGSATSPSLMFHFCTPQGEFVRSAENLLTTVGSLTAECVNACSSCWLKRGPRLFRRVALMAAGLFRPTMAGRKSAAALILLPCALLLIFGTWRSSAAAFLSELSSMAWEIEPWLVGVLQFNLGSSTKVMGKIKARAEDGVGQVPVMIGPRDDRRARGRGGGGQFPQAAHNPYEVRLPHFIESIAECEDNERKTSIIMVDKRDDRIVSPFQAWLVREIMTNRSSSINVLTDRDQVMPPQSGYHLSLFANYTRDGFKATVAISIDSQTGAPYGGWDPATANALSHVAIQPFSWPVLNDTSPSYTCFRADTDLSVQQQFADEFFIKGVCRGRVRLSVVVAAFSGWRVSVFSFECGGRTYSVGPSGTVIAGDSARSRFELRVTDRSSEDAVGNDADRVEFRYRDSYNRIDLKCARTSVPATWLTVSHISGPTLIQTITRCREQRARVEGPEQTEQFAQLAAAHQHWWHKAHTLDAEKVGVLVTFVAGLDAGNFHVQTESKLFVREGPPALAQGAWTAVAETAQAITDTSRGSGEVALRTRAPGDIRDRVFAAAMEPAVPYDQGDEEDTRKHFSDPARDTAREDRSSEVDGEAHAADVRGDVMEAEPDQAVPENLMGPLGEPTSFRPHRQPAREELKKNRPRDHAKWFAAAVLSCHVQQQFSICMFMLVSSAHEHGSSEALLRTRLSNLQLVLAMEVEFARSSPLGHTCWNSSGCSPKRPRLSFRSRSATRWASVDARKFIAQFQRDLVIRALAAPVLAPKAKSTPSAGPGSSSNTPLLDLENAEKQKWAKRRKAIAEPAGSHAKPLSTVDNEILSAEERARLQLLVFTSGAPSTMANHIRRFEKFEAWARRSALPLCPITNDLILKYAVEPDGRGCGPTVIPSLRMALRWVSFRTNIAVPSIDTAPLKALEKEVFTQRGKPLKEADPILIELVMAMEKVADDQMPNPTRIFLWWTSCMIFASLRFDDAIHVKPHELEVKPEGLFGVSWQTKSERKRRGTKFVVPDVSFSKHSWFKSGLDLFELEFPLAERDFWIPDLESKTLWRTTPPDYARSLQWLRHLVWHAGKEAGASQEALQKVTALTWHSARVTMLDQVSKEYEPECAREDDAIDDPEDRGDCLTEFFIKDKIPELALRQIFGRQHALGRAGGYAIWKSSSTLQEHVATRRAKMEEDPSKIPEIPGEDHAKFREIFVNQHPDVILTYMREPHRKFVERTHRDYMVHGVVVFYEVPEMRSRSDQIVSTSGFSKTSDDLLRVVQHDNKISATSEGSVMDRLHAFFVTLEYLNICEFTMEAGPLKYLSEIEEWRHENRGLSLLLSADSLLRKKVYKLSNDRRKDFPTFSSALKEVLKNHKQLWNDARSTAELDKFKQVEHDPSSRSTSPPPPPTPTSEARTKKNRARREKQKALLKQARELAKDKDKDKSGKPSGGARLTARADRDPRIPEKEWKKIMSFTYTGPGRHAQQTAGGLLPEQAKSSQTTLSATTCEAPFQKLSSAALCSTPPWSAWSQVPTDPYLVRDLGPWCLELFAGSGVFTAHLRQRGLRVLPPIDVLQSSEVTEQRDLLDGDFFEQLLLLARMGAIGFLHVGLPCSTFSQARQRPGGPRPLRSRLMPLGLEHRSAAEEDQLFAANELLNRSLLLMHSVINSGDDSLENPLSSLLWQVPAVQQLKVRHRLYNVDFDQCEFGATSKKATRLLVSNALFLQLSRTCSGDHLHVLLKGKVRGSDGRLIFATKPVQIYPVGLALAWSAVVEQILQGTLPQFARSFDLVTEPADRKRKIGESVPWQGHRQEQAARLAAASGYQLKRGAAKPLLEIESEPGVAIRWALQITHPFTVQPEIPAEISDNINAISSAPLPLVDRRLRDLQYWKDRAAAFVPETDEGARYYADLQMGSFTHVKLYDELLEASGCAGADRSLAHGLRTGFPIVGPIQRSGRWPEYPKRQDPVKVCEAESRAWEFRRKIFRRCSAVPVNLRSLWKSTMEDVAEGSTVGPFQSEEEVTQFLGCDDWIPTQRFEVVQKNKVRGCDSATSNLINKTAVITEKLQLPSTDLNVAVGSGLGLEIVVFKDPDDDRPKYFVMIGHSFGLVSAVYNYNRRSAALNDIFTRLFRMVPFNFYDDKYGFETELTAPSAKFVAETIHWLLGAFFVQKKLQLSFLPVVLGVTFNLEDFLLEIKRQYSKDLSGGRMDLNEALKRSLIYWRGLIEFGPPREISLRASKRSDIVIFTDGFTSDQKKAECGPDRIGAVMFDRRGLAPKQFTEVIPRSISEKWIQRKTKIVPIEMIAPILALETFRDHVRNKDVILLIDSEAVEASLVKGYSSKEDLCELVELFWASPAGRSALRGPQLHQMQEPRAAAMCGSLPLVGLAAAVGCVVVARSIVQRRYTGSYNMDPRMARGEPTKMTEEQKAEWLTTKTAELEELMPMTDIEFEDMVSEQTWQWARHLLPFQNRRRHEIAEFKRRCILKQPELFKKLRLWHPLALKYPTVIRRFDNLGPSDIENRDLMIDVEMLANTEKCAGFTYRCTGSLRTPISGSWNFAGRGMVFGAGQGAFAGAVSASPFASGASPFAGNPSPFATSSPGPSACGGGSGGGASASPFGSGGAVASPFSASAGPPQASPFGSGTVSPFAAGGPAQPSASPFGQGGPSASPFAGPGSHAASPFSGNPGGTPASPSPFGGQGSTPSPFSGAANMGSTPPTATQRSSSPFAAGPSQAPSAAQIGAGSAVPFGAQATASPFAGTSSATVASASPFGSQVVGAVGPFGGQGASSASPFAAQSSSSSLPFAAGACSGASPFAQSALAPATASAGAQGTTSPFAPPAQGSASTSTSPFGSVPTSAVASPHAPAGASPFTKATVPVPSAKAGAASKDAKEVLPELLRKVDWQLTSFGLDNQACVVTNDTSFEEHRWLMLQQPRGDWGSLSNKLLSESKQKFSTYLSGSADAAAPSQAQDAASASTRAPSPFDGASRSSSPFGAASASAGGSASAGASPFGASTPSPFGAAGTSASPFGGSQAPGTGPFAQRSTSPGPFATTSSPFAPGPCASPFQSSGQGTPPSPFAPSYATASASVPYDAGVRYGLAPLQMRPHEETELAQEDLKAFEAAAFESQKIPEVEPPPSVC